MASASTATSTSPQQKLYVATSLITKVENLVLDGVLKGFEIVNDPNEAELMIFDLDHPPMDWANYITSSSGLRRPVENVYVLDLESRGTTKNKLIMEQILAVFGPKMQQCTNINNLTANLTWHLKNPPRLPRKTVAELTVEMLKARMSSPIRVFVSYSHVDAEWLQRLKKMCRPLTGVQFWDDTQTEPGGLWRDNIQTRLEWANVAVLLVTPDFLDSNFILNNELPTLLEAAQVGSKRILWVAVRDSLVEETAIGKYQCANEPSRPLAGLDPPELETALKKIAKVISSTTS